LQIFKNAWFNRFARREKIADKTLRDTVSELERGGIDADLGGNVVKQRIARSGQGKSSGYRAVLIFKKDGKAFFVYGFPKNEKENISKKELSAFKKMAREMLALSDDQIQKLIKNRGLMEIKS